MTRFCFFLQALDRFPEAPTAANEQQAAAYVMNCVALSPRQVVAAHLLTLLSFRTNLHRATAISNDNHNKKGRTKKQSDSRVR